MSSQSLELVLSVENDCLCNMPILSTKTDWRSHFRLLGPEWQGNTILRAILSYLRLFWGQSLCPGGCPLFCFRVCLSLVCLDMLMISWSGMPRYVSSKSSFPPSLSEIGYGTHCPWPVCGWGRFGAKTSALLGAELQEVASDSQSSHLPRDKLLCVLWLYTWLRCSWPNGCRLCQRSGFLSFTVLSILRFASFISSIFRFS